MVSPLVVITRIELRKIFHRRFSAWLPVFMLGVLLIILGGYAFTSGDSGEGSIGWKAVSSGLQWSVNWGYLLLFVYASQFISGERVSGTLNTILTRPLSRSNLFHGKLLALEVYGMALIMGTVLIAVLLGVILFGLKDVTLEGFVLASNTKLTGQLMQASLLSFVTILPMVSLGLLISVLTDNTTSSVLGAVAVFLLIRLLLENITAISPYVFNSYIDAQFVYLSELSKGLSVPRKVNMVNNIIVPLCYFAVFALIGTMIFRRKDLQ